MLKSTAFLVKDVSLPDICLSVCRFRGMDRSLGEETVKISFLLSSSKMESVLKGKKWICRMVFNSTQLCKRTEKDLFSDTFYWLGSTVIVARESPLDASRKHASL